MLNRVKEEKMPNIKNRNQGRGSNLSSEARSKGGSNSPGNFKNDPERASEAGRKGGEASHGGRSTR
jgi:general stress protein YciG